MNLFLILAFVLGGGTIQIDHQVRELPHRLAVILYTAAVLLFVIGMIAGRKAGA